MSITPADVITDVKKLVQDNPLMRMPDTFIALSLLEFVNMTIKRIISFRPDEFTYYGVLTPTVGSAYQTLPADGVRVMEILSAIVSAVPSAITEADKDTLDRSTPTWLAATAGTPVNWCRHPRNPRAYFLYPPPASGVTLNAEYVKVPAVLTVSDPITLLPDSYLPILVSGTAYMVEAVYNGTSGERAKMFWEEFVAGMKASDNSRHMVDDERAGIEGTRKP